MAPESIDKHGFLNIILKEMKLLFPELNEHSDQEIEQELDKYLSTQRFREVLISSIKKEPALIKLAKENITLGSTDSEKRDFYEFYACLCDLADAN